MRVSTAPMAAQHLGDGAMRVESGKPRPLGVEVTEDGCNFAVFSRHATRVWLMLFREDDYAAPLATFELDPQRHRTGDDWHIWIAGVRPGHAYAYRMDGPYRPEQGHRFNPHRVLIDPYARALVDTDKWDFARARADAPDVGGRSGSAANGDNHSWAAKCLIVDTSFDWQGQARPRHAWRDTVIYETHVRGLTIHPSSAVDHPGTFLGVAEKIPYFKRLGITALELMPVQDFNGQDVGVRDPVTGEPLANYWGYGTVAFFAPKERYGTGSRPGVQVTEFKTMVRALHRAGIEVILDVAFGHTPELDEHGPTVSFRGLGNAIYYLLADDKRFYRDFTGCKNTLSGNHPVVRGMILDCLRYWVTEMGVDGFRFDLASVLGRDENGAPMANPPLLEAIAADPVLGDVKLIAEPWDAAGAYQVGAFPGARWAEWNGRFRDDVRRFWRGDAGTVGLMASRLCGSADLYQRGGKLPINSINFITAHDGFTLNDLVSYRCKHNQANGQDNQDGTANNYSDNHGVEGHSDDPAVETTRRRQIKNLLASLFIARGVPMLLGGDEFRRSQRGNNNAYCQDNEVSWYDWSLLARNRDITRFVRGLIRLRHEHPVLREEDFFEEGDIRWFGPDGTTPDWHDAMHALGCAIRRPNAAAGYALCILLNPGPAEVCFALPTLTSGRRWYDAVDTACEPPDDVRWRARQVPLGTNNRRRVQAHATVILTCR